jgi:hypothetical protein
VVSAVNSRLSGVQDVMRSCLLYECGHVQTRLLFSVHAVLFTLLVGGVDFQSVCKK